MREMSLGGGMGTRNDNLRVGSEAHVEISLGVKKIRGEVMLRRARVNESVRVVSMDSTAATASARPGRGSAKSSRQSLLHWDGERKRRTRWSGPKVFRSSGKPSAEERPCHPHQNNRRDAACRVSRTSQANRDR